MKIHIPTPLRAFTDKQETVSVEAATVDEALHALTAAHPAMQNHLYTPEGKLRSFVNVYLNDEDVRYLADKEGTKVGSNDELTIIPSIAGGLAGKSSPVYACPILPFRKIFAMKSKLALLLFALCVSVSARASTVLPDACGNNKVNFDIDSEKDQPAPGNPEAGKAQIVFIETLDKSGVIGSPTTRFGLDGAWVGATKGNAYFVVSVAPGEHHLCANWSKMVGVNSFTAEAGKTYYYEFKIVIHHSAGPMVMGGSAAPGQSPPMVVGGGSTDLNHGSGFLGDDEGKYRIKASVLSVSKPKS